MGSTPTRGTSAVYLVIFVRKLSIEMKAIAIIAFSIHTQFIHIARGFQGDELTCSAFPANSSALEPSSRSSASAIGLSDQGDPPLLNSYVQGYVLGI